MSDDRWLVKTTPIQDFKNMIELVDFNKIPSGITHTNKMKNKDYLTIYRERLINTPTKGNRMKEFIKWFNGKKTTIAATIWPVVAWLSSQDIINGSTETLILSLASIWTGMALSHKAKKSLSTVIKKGL